MCGIFGLIVDKDSGYPIELIKKIITNLALLSETRGKDSSGIAFRNEENKTINVYKGSAPISQLITESFFKEEIQNYKSQGNVSCASTKRRIYSVLGHARLVTNGTQMKSQNNQPVIKDGLVGVHNGIIVNIDQLWEKAHGYKREYEIDTEVMFSLFRYFEENDKASIPSVSRTIKEIYGTVATAFFIDNKNEIVLATNNGSLYIVTDSEKILFFASEKYILECLIEKIKLEEQLIGYNLAQVKSNTGFLIDFNDFKIERFDIINTKNGHRASPADKKFSINIKTFEYPQNQQPLIVDSHSLCNHPNAIHEAKLLEFNTDKIKKLQRCKKCLLPETFPFLSFNSEGICNICTNYKLRNQPKPLEELFELVEPYKRKNGEYDCIVPFSGGRDSSFSLHMAKKVLGLNPITLTYDWGMVTDLARRNIARVCGALGVENIIVAADIHKKRKYIHMNILAWLKKPKLGIIPLFMAGDKYFFYYTKQLKKQTGIHLNIWGVNNLENTDFKYGFAGVKPKFDKERIYSISTMGKLSFFAYIGKNIIQNPSYVNSSNTDSLGSLFSRYFFPKKDYYHFFDYYQWNEIEIVDLLRDKYDWEIASDTKSTWRIGDGTASFYNYIYYTIAGFSEIDTFRSNQIREGLISREEGLSLAEEENRPRYESIKWYLEIVGLDFKNIISSINRIPKLYRN